MQCMQGEWAMRFSSNAAAALAELATQPADVVVADMRMPGVDGPEFLTEIKRRYPEAMRIMLSGQADSDSIIRVSRGAHRYLSKPCDALTLQASIARMSNLKAVLTDAHLAAMVGSVGALPTPPKTYQLLLECLRNPDSAIIDVTRVIRQDMAMTAKILKLANSGYFAIREPVQTIDRAVAFVGMEAISILVLGQELFDNKGSITMAGFDLPKLGKHCFETAAWARAIALHENLSSKLAEAAFLAGVLHDVGRLVFATRVQRAPHSLPEQMQAHHAAVGGYLLGLWGFAETIVEAIVWHHMPSKCGETRLGLCGLLHVADVLAHARERGCDDTDGIGLEPGYLESLGLAEKWPAWLKLR